MLKLNLIISILFMAMLATFVSVASAREVRLEPGEQVTIRGTTVTCQGNVEPNPKWFCGCFIGFAQIGGVKVFAPTTEQAEKLALPKCIAERSPDINAVDCVRD